MQTTKKRGIGLFIALVAICAMVLLMPQGKAQTVTTRNLQVLQLYQRITRQNGDVPYEQDFQKIRDTVQKRFYDSTFNGVDWNRITARYQGQLAAVKSKTEFAALMNQMLGELHASHTAYVTDADVEYYMLNAVNAQEMQRFQVAHIGVMGERDAKGYVVHAVLDGGAADKAGIQAGDRLLQVDGKPFASAGSFRGKEGIAVQVQLQREGDAKPRTVDVTPVRQNILKAYLDATRVSARFIDVGNRRLGYVHLWTMAHDAFKDMLDSLMTNKLHDTDGLILDLRDGYGGHPFGFMDVFSRPDVAWETEYANGRITVQYTGYSKPVVVLINEGTRSAKEFLTYQMKTTHRATIVGTRTAGAFLGAGFVRIGDDALLELPEVGLKVDGQRLENKGISADVIVAAKYAYSSRDAQMAQAQQVLLKLIPESTPERKKQAIIHVH